MNLLVFLVLLATLVLVHELGHFTLAKLAGVKVEEFGLGFPPRLLGIRRGETIYSLNAIPLGGFVRMLGEEDPTHPRSFARAPKRWRTAILLAGPVMNFLAAAVFFTAAFLAGWPTPTAFAVEIFRVLPGTPAEQAGLQVGDLILQVEGQPVTDTRRLRDITQQHLGRPMTLLVRRGDQEIAITVVPRTQWPEGEGPIGIGIVDRPTRIEPVPYPLPEAIVRGLQRTLFVIIATPYLPILALRGLVPLDLLRPVGPVGLYQVTSQATSVSVETGWLFPILSVAGTLSAGLGVANLLPIPGLDGGRLLFIALEAIRGRRVSPEREGLIHLLGITLLMGLLVIITYFDLVSPIAVDWSLR